MSSVLSIKKLIQAQILMSLPQMPDNLAQTLSLMDIPLVATITNIQLIYRSAITLKWAKKFSLTPETFAAQLFTTLINLPSESNNNNYSNLCSLTLQVQLVDQVWLLFYLDFQSLQPWLTVLSQHVNCLPTRSPTRGITESHAGAYGQYAHARASALLRLAEQEKLFFLLPLKFPNTALLILSTLFHLSPPTRSLLEQILRVTDQLDSENPDNWLKVSKHLSESFLQFERHCRLFSDENCPSHQFKWLLLINTRYLLQIILLTKLKIPAPDEL